MSGEYKAPYRPPCSGNFVSASKLRIGCNNSRAPNPPPTKWTNITRVQDYRDPGDERFELGGIPPYPQPYLNHKADGSCVDDDPECYDPANVPPIWEKKCATGLGGYQDDRAECTTPNATHATIVKNCFEKAVDNPLTLTVREDLLSFPICNRGYFKNVQASKVWHGRYGYLSHDQFSPGVCIDMILGLQRAADYICDGAEPPDCDTVTPEEDCPNNFESLQPTPDNTKYLSVVATSHCNYTFDDVETDYGHAERTIIVNRNSGVTTQTGSEDFSVGREDLAEVATDHIAENVGSETGIQTSVGKFITYLLGIRDHYSTTPHTYDFVFTHSATEATSGKGHRLKCEVQYVYDDDYPAFELEVDTGTGYFHYWEKTSTGLVLQEETITMTDTEYTWTTRDNAGSATYYQNNTVTCNLGVIYTGDDLRADGYALAGEWNLTDDTRYQWRMDEFVGVAPLVTRDEWQLPRGPTEIHPLTMFNDTNWEGRYANPPEPMPLNWEETHQSPWLEQGYTNGVANPPLYSGEIRGAPLPLGYEGFFDSRHRTWKTCTELNGYVQRYVKFYGAWAGGFVPAAPADTFWPPLEHYRTDDPSDEGIPRFATQWTENISGPGRVYGGGAWCDIYGGRLMLQKWAELKVRRPSHNYFRPCGKDRYAVDSTSLRCVVESVVGEPPTPTVITLHEDSDVTTGTKCMVGDKVYAVTRNSATEFELTTLVATVPADCALEANQFCKLRIEDAWPICGRLGVTLATQNDGNVDLEIEAAPYLRTGDIVVLTDIPGLAATNYVVTVTDSTHVSVIGTLSDDYDGGGYISSHGAPIWHWHDDQPKGDYRYLVWSHNFRDYQEADRVCGDANANAGPPLNCPVDTTGLTCDSGISDVRQNQSLWDMPRSVDDFTFTGHCLDFACQMVMCISPNGENWSEVDEAKGRTHGFPGTTNVEPDGTSSAAGGSFIADGRYASLWQAVVQQHIYDPFWQEPPKPCVECDEETPAVRPTSCNWDEDEGKCPGDTCPEDCERGTRLYPQRPWEEARVALPVNNGQTAPELPDGFYLFPLPYEELDTLIYPGGQVIPPPPLMEFENLDLQMPWGIFEREMECVCNEGRFESEYESNQVKC